MEIVGQGPPSPYGERKLMPERVIAETGGDSRLDLGLDLTAAATVPGPRAFEGRGATAPV